ncbi:MAG: hypothetical protein ABI903_06740 [Actinomycetota bacterium]
MTSAPTLWRLLARRLAGVRVRSTIAAVLVVAVAFTAGAALLLLLLQHALDNSIRDAAGMRAGEVATLLRAEGVKGLGERLLENNREGQIVQVVSQGGTVVATSAPKTAKAPLSSARPGQGQVRLAEAESLSTARSEAPT